jgi:L-fucose isomerase-like protein
MRARSSRSRCRFRRGAEVSWAMAVKIREIVETRLGPGTFTVRLNDGREFTMRNAKIDDCVDAMNAAREGYLPSDLFEKCAVGPAITWATSRA